MVLKVVLETIGPSADLRLEHIDHDISMSHAVFLRKGAGLFAGLQLGWLHDRSCGDLGFGGFVSGVNYEQICRRIARTLGRADVSQNELSTRGLRVIKSTLVKPSSARSGRSPDALTAGIYIVPRILIPTFLIPMPSSLSAIFRGSSSHFRQSNSRRCGSSSFANFHVTRSHARRLFSARFPRDRMDCSRVLPSLFQQLSD